MISWIVLVPGISSAICGAWTTAGYGLLAVATYVLVDSAWPEQYQAGLGDFILVAVGGALATLAAAARVRRERQVVHIRDIADTTRRTVLRPLPPDWAGLEQAGVYLAADVEARVGGDFYDIQPSPHGTRVLVGDVQGKGLGAVEAAAALLGTFREAGFHEKDLATVAERLEIRMLRHRSHTVALGGADGDRFATAVLISFPFVPDDVRRAFTARLLDPLKDYDRRHRAELIPTLEAFLDCDGSWTRCATRLHLHVNTLRYRVGRIEQLTGRDLSRLEDKLDFFLALRMS
ncbi:helix-turn-helix domain-containing protein [Streptomyces eurythermus]